LKGNKKKSERKGKIILAFPSPFEYIQSSKGRREMAQVQNFAGGMVTVKVGDWVGFKSDIEQSGQIVEIRGNQLVLKNKSGFSGGYIGGKKQTIEFAGDCWVE
jgi:uncharacterized protein Veg